METLGSQQVKEEKGSRSLISSLLLLIIFRRKHCRVVGNSMFPTISNGDIIIYKPLSSIDKKNLIKEHSILVIKDPLKPRNLLIKRLHHKTINGLHIQGDNSAESIDSRNFGFVSLDNLCGIVEHIITNPFS